MRRASWWLCGVLICPALLRAQSPGVPAPATCSTSAAHWFDSTYKAARTAAAHPGAKAVDVAGLLAQRTALMKACAAQFHISLVEGAALLDLASLYSQVGEDSLAKAAVDKRLAQAGLNEHDRAMALVAMIGTYTKPDTLVIVGAEPYMTALDALSDSVVLLKLEGHNRLSGEYRYLDVDARIRQHALAIIAIGRHLKAGTAAPGGRMPEGTVAPYALLTAYTNLAEVYGDFGHADSSLLVLDQALKDHPEIAAKDAEQFLTAERERYQLVGRAAMTIDAAHWLNAPAGHRTLDPKGKVTVIEFTAHWCVPCRNSYPAMSRMERDLGKRGVQFVFATEFYGYLGAKRPLDAAQEYDADREYFITEHGIHFPIAIADQPPPYQPGKPYQSNINDTRYKVGGIPQIVIIDREGTIRRILTGWDTGNAERMPGVIDALLKEKTGVASATP